MTQKTALTPATHTTPSARFSRSVRKGDILQVAGQVGFLPAEQCRPPTPAGPTLREQTRQTLADAEAILEEGGAGWDDVMMIRVHLTDTDHFAEMNDIYDVCFDAQYLTRPPAARCPLPAARTTVHVGLPAGLLVAIDALAVLDRARPGHRSLEESYNEVGG
ncbi:RidA family protein [Streptomyces actuosus]|uniref:RidA family protein n=1 Tax=Streptomyces actuosus TaxID=1885 RepID=A0ABS2VQH1_STRAS|nr:RidA family protein [Streptomyces actuosus]MBN0045321.1 RidA family protein [Streptomyces actuosus]